MKEKNEDTVEVTRAGQVKIDLYEVTVGYRKDGFPIECLRIEHKGLGGLVEQKGAEVCEEVIKIYQYSILDSWTGNYETHYDWGWDLIGHYDEYSTKKKLEENLKRRLLKSELPDKIKKLLK